MNTTDASQHRLRQQHGQGWMHTACLWYCHGNEHAMLVTALPTIPHHALAAFATTMGGRLRSASPAPEADPTTYRPDLRFDVDTGAMTSIDTHPPGVIVWRLQIDFVQGLPRRFLPPAVGQATRRQGVLRRLHHWFITRRHR